MTSPIPAARLGVFLIGIVGLPVFAQPAPANGPCADDAKKFCADVKPGEGRVAACLKEHENELSAQCKEQREKARAKGNAFGRACGKDIRKFCAGMQVGGGRVMECLNRNSAELTESCKSHLESRAAPAPEKPVGSAPSP
jgi:hypothetical protein